ncbi:hypothetical protein ABX022_01735 [Snodgrassella alvi]|uniref:hypothetical protein n=1 Tax=Snodgrassella alvi TaxID=1196083 RepID=UPI00351C8679
MRHYTLKPITLAKELEALDQLEARDNKPATEREEEVLTTLTYISKMITIKGIDPEDMSVAFLLNNLYSYDYENIVQSVERLNAKYRAAGQSAVSDTKAAENESATR